MRQLLFLPCPHSWSKPQVEARAHPNVLKASAWLNKFYHTNGKTQLDGVDLTTPLSYADRYRIRKADGKPWTRHPPHVDGMAYLGVTTCSSCILMLSQ